MIRSVKKIMGFLCSLLVLLTALSGCGKIADSDKSLGSWHAGETVDTDSTEKQTEQTGDKEAAMQVEKLELNTDVPGSGLSVELSEFIGANLILKVTNTGNVCYDRVVCTIVFYDTTGYFYVEEGQVNSKYYASLGEIPAYSEVYVAVDMPTYTVKATEEKEESDDDRVYYYFLNRNNLINMVISEYDQSSVDMQDARDAVTAGLSDLPYDGDVALFGNRSAEKIHCEAYAIFDEKEVCKLENLGDIFGKGDMIKDTRDNPAWFYDAATGECKSVGYAWNLLNPLAQDGLAVRQIHETSEQYSTPDPDAYSSIRILISRAYYLFE